MHCGAWVCLRRLKSGYASPDVGLVITTSLTLWSCYWAMPSVENAHWKHSMGCVRTENTEDHKACFIFNLNLFRRPATWFSRHPIVGRRDDVGQRGKQVAFSWSETERTGVPRQMPCRSERPR